MQGSHSLFGLIWSIQKETGWSHKYILWGEPWINLQIKFADAPRMITGKRKNIVRPENWEQMIEQLAE